MPLQTFTYDQAQALDQCTFVKGGYDFVGWSNLAAGDVIYADGQSVKNLTATPNLTVPLYAVWQKTTGGPVVPPEEPVVEPMATNAIAYVGLEGAANPNPATFTANDLPLVLEPLTREGYTFLGWTPNGGIIPIGTVTNVTFTAVWSDDSATDEQKLSVSGQGWHEVSFAVLPESGDPADVFAPVEDKVGYVTYGSLNWNPLTGGTLMALEIGKGYWVQTTADTVEWTVTGQTNPDVEIELKPGWNLIGYPLLEEGEVETVLATALATEKIDWIYSGSRVYPGTLTTLAPGKGYWVYANAAVTIRFDAK